MAYPQQSFTQYSGAGGAPPPPPPSYTPPPAPSMSGMPYAASSAPADPYSAAGQSGFNAGQSGFNMGQPGFNTGQPGFNTGQPGFTQPKKSSAKLLIILGVVVVVLVVIFASLGALSKSNTGTSTNSSSTSSSSSTGLFGNTGNTNNNATNFPASQQLGNLSVVYADDQVTFTSLQQADQFPDDTLTTFSTYDKSYYVRLNFKEQQQGKNSSYFSYTSSLHLLLPDNSVIAGLKAQEYTGPEQGVQRTNWIDFETKKPVDLSKLTLRMGASDEQQMQFALQNGADVSKYQSKTVTLNKQFQYAGMNWTLKDATQSLYTDGKQAKTDKVYITIDLVANNNSSNDYYLNTYPGFVLLQAGSTTSQSDTSSNLSSFGTITSGTTNVQGTAVYLTPTASTYTLKFLAGDQNAWPAQTLDFQIS